MHASGGGVSGIGQPMASATSGPPKAKPPTSVRLRHELDEMQTKAEIEITSATEPTLSHVMPPTVIRVRPKSSINRGPPDWPQMAIAPQASVGVGVQEGGVSWSK